LISYLAGSGLKTAHCQDTACSAASTATVDSYAATAGPSTSITIAPDAMGVISYYDPVNSDLKVAHCSNTACSVATSTVVDSVGSVGTSSAITVGIDGLGFIAYNDGTNGDQKVAHCSNVFCLPFARSR
jgi:hypothetical protein